MNCTQYLAQLISKDIEGKDHGLFHSTIPAHRRKCLWYSLHEVLCHAKTQWHL